MEYPNATYAYAGVFVDELARSGVRHAVVCPGSRSTPLAWSFASHPAIHAWAQIDERSAAFFALGLAKVTGQPAALVCTSGTAAANFLPAVAEANLSRVPLLVLTADRPPELRDNGAPQSMDQVRLYGTHAKWFAEMALPEASDELLRYARTIACRAAATARAAPAGAVHINLPFREPLSPAPIPGRPLPPLAERDPVAWQGRPRGRPYVDVPRSAAEIDGAQLDELAGALARARRGLIVAGPQDDPALAAPLARLAERYGFPLLADPLSQLRHGQAEQSLIVDNYDVFLRDDGFVGAMAPELVLRFGAMPTAKTLLLYLRAHPAARQIVVDLPSGWNEPTLRVEQLIPADPLRLVEDLLSLETPGLEPSEWTTEWQAVSAATRELVDQEIGEYRQLFEGRVWPELLRVLPSPATVLVGNSMPVRDCDTFFARRGAALRVLGNRGANGIDGLVSTACGMAAVSPDPVMLVVGDLSFYHDLNGLLAAKRHGLSLTIVVVNNDGGGIFSFLPQAAHPEHFEEFWATPTGLDFGPIVEAYGGRFHRAHDWAAFRAAVRAGLAGDGLTVVELPTDRTANVAMHRRLWERTSAMLARRRAGTAG